MHISITGLKPKGFWGVFRFWRYAVPSFAQAKKANGNLFCEVKKVNGYQCTLTAWESREQMLTFMRSGIHLQAMQQFHKIATGKTYGYETEQVPTLEEAFALLEEKGRVY